MHLAIRYVSRFVYDEPVRESHNMLRACPEHSLTQRLLNYRVQTHPAARIVTFTDYWGTRVDAFGIAEPHSALEVIAESEVETSEPVQPLELTIDPSAYSDEVRRSHGQYLQKTRHTAWDDSIRSSVEHLLPTAGSAVAAIGEIEEMVRERLDYSPGTTFIGVDVNDLVEAGKGVCQDFAHLAIAYARSAGIPARYVSGYLYAADQSIGDAPRDAEVEIQTHAWLEALIPGWGWWAIDPTNTGPVGERHVKIGHGRDYDDVMPLRGVYHGDPDHELGVSVQISRDQLSAIQQQQ